MILSFVDVIRLFFLLSSLQPLVRRWVLQTQRMQAFRGLEKRRGSRVIGLIHRQETMNFLGFPVARYIDIEDSEAVLRAIQLTDPEVPIDMILHTPGGLVLAASQIAAALKSHKAKVTPPLPLGEAQLGQHPAASVVKVVDEKPIAEIDDNTLIEADMARKALNQVERFVCALLEERMGANAQELAHTLASGTWTHDYPITANEARQLGLTVSTSMPTEVYDLMQLYPQTAQRRPSVEYIPLPYRAPGRELAPQRRSSGATDV